MIWRPWKALSRRRDSSRLLLFFHETTWSGAPIQLLYLATWLKENSWTVAGAVPDPQTPESGPITPRLSELGIDTFPILDLALPANFQVLQDLCREFDVVIANTLVMWSAIHAARQTGVPSIWYIHESQVGRHLMDRIPETKPALSCAHVLVTPTRRTAELYQPYIARPIEVVPYGIPPSHVRPVSRLSSGPGFLLLGSYEPRKGQDIFLKAIRQIPEPHRERATFRMAGRPLDKDFFAELKSQAALLPGAELGASLEHAEALAAIAAADVLVCASRDETMPVAILEAMSMGKAIVTTQVGGIAEWLCHDREALIVSPEDAGALAVALQRCLEEPSLRATLGKNARHTFQKHFSIDRLGKTFSRLITHLPKKSQ